MRDWLYIILMYFIIRTVMKYVVPAIKRGTAEQARRQHDEKLRRQFGKTQILSKPENKSHFDGGQYVDYEEVK